MSSYENHALSTPSLVTTCPSILAGRVGGKYRLSREIIRLIPPHRCYVEPFCGAAWVFFRKTPSGVEVLNDRDSEIANLFRVVRDQPEQLLTLWLHTPWSREEFLRLYAADFSAQSPLRRAWRFLYLNMVTWGNKSSQQPTFRASRFGKGYKIARYDARVEACCRRLRDAVIENLDCQAVIDLYDGADTFFYLDPPYYGFEKYYAAPFGADALAALAERLKTIRGKFLLSINDIPETREIFAGFHIRQTSVNYSLSLIKRKPAAELLIANYPI